MNFYFFVFLIFLFILTKIFEILLKKSEWKFIISDIIIFIVSLLLYIYFQSFNKNPLLLRINSLMGIVLMFTLISSLASVLGIADDLQIGDFIILVASHLLIFVKNRFFNIRN